MNQTIINEEYVLKNLGRTGKLLMLANFTFALSYGLWFYVRQLYLADLGATPEQIGTALALGAIASGAAPVPAGFITDRIGPRWVIVGAWLVALAGTVLMALAGTWQSVTIGLVIFMLCGAANPALATYALLSAVDENGQDNSEWALGTIFFTWPAALIFSPALGGLIAEKYGIRADLWIATAGCAIAILVISLAGHVEPGRQMDETRPTLLSRNRAFLVLVGYYTVTTVALYVGYMLAPNFLEGVRGFSPATIGLLFSVMSVGTVGFNLIVRRVSPRRGFLILLVIPWLALLGLWQLSAPGWTGAAFFMLGGIATVWVMTTAGIGRVVSERNRGLALGIKETLEKLAIAVAAGLAGQLYALTPGHDLPLVVGLIGIPLVLGVWFLIPAASQSSPGPAVVLHR